MEQTAAQRREAWGRRHGWSMFGVLGLLLLSFALWALSEDRPAMAGVPMGMAGGFIVLSLYLFVRRDRREVAFSTMLSRSAGTRVRP